MGLPIDISWNPLMWGSWAYVLLILGCLVTRWLIPASQRWQTRVMREFLLIAPAALLYFLVRGVVDARDSVAFDNARRVIDLERKLGISVEHQLQEWILRNEMLVNIANWIYIWSHWPVIAVTIIWLVVCHRIDYPRYRNAMLLSGAIGIIVFALFPVAPPRLMPDLNVVDTVTARSNSYRVLQPPSLTNPYAAMPSLHFGWNLLMGIAIYRLARRRVVKWLGVAMPIAMFIAIVLTANHYIVDGVAGGTLVIASLWLVSRQMPVEALSRFASGLYSGRSTRVSAHQAQARRSDEDDAGTNAGDFSDQTYPRDRYPTR